MNFVAWMNGTAGRWLRVVAGVALIVIGALVGGVGGVVLGVVGLVALIAGAAGACLLAPLFHAPLRAR